MQQFFVNMLTNVLGGGRKHSHDHKQQTLEGLKFCLRVASFHFLRITSSLGNLAEINA